MIFEFYHIRCILVATALLTCILMFMFVDVPGNPLLRNYRRARYALVAAYLYLTAMNAACCLFDVSVTSNSSLIQAVILIVAFSQAVLFMLALLALLEVSSKWKSHLFTETLLLIIATFVIYSVYAVCSEAVFDVAFYVFSGIYALLLVHYTRLFIAEYRRFHLQMDNYFSDHEAERMRWAAFSAFATLCIGIMALLSAVFPSIIAIFTLVYGVFYVWFAIRFINYAHRFHIIVHALENEQANEIIPPQTGKPLADNVETFHHIDTTAFAALEQRIEQWVAEKQFAQKGVTIDMLVPKLYTNRFYLSSYINTCKGKTFREWINELKVEEAKNLMRQYPDTTLNEIAQQAGFADRSHFTRQFTRQTGVSPAVWRQQNILL